jgi:hypothetical protein
MSILIKNAVIAVDFDGTCVTHEFPKVGRDIGAVPILKELIKQGHKLILFTMRSDIINPKGEDNELHLESGNYLSDAVKWFKDNEIELYGIQTNPTQHTWTTSPKAYAKLYLDDAALGIPLVHDLQSGKPHVDWKATRNLLIWRGYLPE